MKTGKIRLEIVFVLHPARVEGLRNTFNIQN